MVKMLEIREMVRLVDLTSLEKLEVNDGNLRILIKRGETAPVPTITEISPQLVHSVETERNDQCESEVSPQTHIVQSRNVGTFQSIVRLGDNVEMGTLLGHCSVPALNLKLEITSDFNGIISDVLVEEGQLIDYGQPLFKISGRKELIHV
jgi:acetyl-CoA carboxylase biotin carboxyl carrier protein